MTLGAGQGKTLVYLLVAMMLNSDDRTAATHQTFNILTSSNLLAKQLQEIIRKHEIDTDIDVLYQPNFADFRAPDLYIIDESD